MRAVRFSALAGQAGQVDQVLDAGHGVGHAERAGRVRARPPAARRRSAQVPMAIVASAPPQTSRAISSAERAADRAVGAVGAGRDRALDDGDVLARASP